MTAVFWKELADYFGSRRFFTLLLFIGLAGVWAAYASTRTIRAEAAETSSELIFLRLFATSSGFTPTFLFYVSFFGPLLGLALGFDAINGERTRGTLSRVLSQPIYRDAIISGKFLAGVALLAIALLALVIIVFAFGIYFLGFPPTFAEAVRVLLFLGISVVYIAFWLALSLLFSILFNQASVSAMASLGLWLVLTFFTSFLATTVADLAEPKLETEEQLSHHRQIEQRVERLSPAFLYNEATTVLLTPTVRSLEPISIEELVAIQGREVFFSNPLPLGQSLTLIWPHLMGILAATSVIFALAYVRFMREEIRF